MAQRIREHVFFQVIYQCRFMAFLGTLGSLLGSVLCFIKVKATADSLLALSLSGLDDIVLEYA